MSIKVTLPYVMVLLARSIAQQTPLCVLPHEVDVLRAVHGEDKILDGSHIQLPEGVTTATFDTEEEYSRLEQIYKGDRNGIGMVQTVWPSYKQFEDSFDADDEDDERPKKAAAQEPEKTEADLEKEQLIAEAKDLGVHATKNWGVDKLKKEIALAKEIAFNKSLKSATPAEAAK